MQRRDANRGLVKRTITRLQSPRTGMSIVAAQAQAQSAARRLGEQEGSGAQRRAGRC